MESVFALSLAFILDAWLGDPVWPYHPVRLIGGLAVRLEFFWRRFGPRIERTAGFLFVLSALAAVFACCGWLYLLPWPWRLPFEAALMYFCLAFGSLKDEATAVAARLESGDIAGARARLQTLVSRDVSKEAEAGLVRGTIETVTENISDAVVAPLFWFAVGGAPLALMYKAVNTLDSMVGYRDAKYLRFGWFSARLDDAANFVPARITGSLMLLTAFFNGRDVLGSWRIWRRDAQKGPSPNGGIPIVAFAGAERMVLGGNCRAADGSTIEIPVVGEGRPADGTPDIFLALFYLTQVTIFAFSIVTAIRILA